MISRTPSFRGAPGSSPEISPRKITSFAQPRLDFDANRPASGSMDDASMIRGVLLQAIKQSGKSREIIAEDMSYLLARQVTEKMLNAFTAESRDDRRWPAEFDRAFCTATGDDTLLRCRCEAAGLVVIDAEEQVLLELGRQTHLRNQANEQIAMLERRLQGRVA